ncbi:MAG: DUF3253 domain-containing protein [Pseudomonadota bacterium]
MSDAPPSDAQIAAALMAALRQRGAGKTICPSEVARALTPDWRPLMHDVRRIAQVLADSGDITITQRGHPVAAPQARGPIRLGLPPSSD